jgi:hypothetical protein
MDTTTRSISVRTHQSIRLSSRSGRSYLPLRNRETISARITVATRHQKPNCHVLVRRVVGPPVTTIHTAAAIPTTAPAPSSDQDREVTKGQSYLVNVQTRKEEGARVPDTDLLQSRSAAGAVRSWARIRCESTDCSPSCREGYPSTHRE